MNAKGIFLAEKTGIVANGNADADSGHFDPGQENRPPSGRYLFYRYRGETWAPPPGLPPQYSWSMWRPSEGRPWPGSKCNAKTRLRFLFRYGLHHLGFFANANCGAMCIVGEGKLIHYSAFTPRYWRFPFLHDNDLQVGDTWTEPSYRGQGLAQFALLQILEKMAEIGRDFWYVVDRENHPSIAVAEKAGFRCAGTGDWVKPCGIQLLGSYAMRTGTQERSAIIADQISSIIGSLQQGPGPSARLPR